MMIIKRQFEACLNSLSMNAFSIPLLFAGFEAITSVQKKPLEKP